MKHCIIGLIVLLTAACQPSNQEKTAFQEQDTLDIKTLTSVPSDPLPVSSYAEQHYQAGVQAFNEKNYHKAKHHLSMAADENHAIALTALGDLARLGLIGEQEKKKTQQYYEKALLTQNPQVQYHIANLIIQGEWQSYLNPLLLLEQAAYNKETKAQLLLAQLYEKGQGVPHSKKIALKWYTAASTKEPEAMIAVGLAFIQGGDDIEKNETLGIQFLKQAAAQNYFPAKYALANLFVEGYNVLADRFQAIEILQEAAKNNHVEAQIKLARALIQFSIPEYDKAAFGWLNKATESQSPDAYYWLAVCYYDGIGTEINYPKAFELLLKLAQEKYVLSYLKLGQLYYEGKGTPQNYAEAKTWLLKAAQRGEKEAQKWVIAVYRDTLDDVDTPENQAAFRDWLDSLQGDQTEGLYLKGIAYLYGKNQIEQNTARGLQYLEEAANANDILAQRELGKIYENGLFGVDNPGTAYHWYLKAAQNGDRIAQLRLAYQLSEGNGVHKNLVEAYAWANLVALTGNMDALSIREEITAQLSATQINQAQALSERYIELSGHP